LRPWTAAAPSAAPVSIARPIMVTDLFMTAGRNRPHRPAVSRVSISPIASHRETCGRLPMLRTCGSKSRLPFRGQRVAVFFDGRARIARVEQSCA
jgi:hypothetical protein